MEYKLLCVLAITLVLGFSSLAEGQAAYMEKQCSQSPKQRENCGQAGISATECYDKGCCFDNSVPETIWCFHPQNECL
ncbi:trefoil factor 1 [Microcaecilia unicolor]|uniref:Trefoil factor 1-like n=1 Tax=Microcaecilia unicolor TaxID=1415580 RepID=A0A6P7YD98_9AMPH|nr:trefoil factor 1-like [Microcaecilia unicolor]